MIGSAAEKGMVADIESIARKAAATTLSPGCEWIVYSSW